jgi:hypothetical protein
MMAGSKNTVIFYQNQIKICKKHMTSEQFGRLMSALFELDEGGNPEVDDDIALAFEFMSVQQQVDREKYEKRCAANRKNGKKGGRPKKNPQNPNGFLENPNDDEDEDDEMIMNDDDDSQHSVSLGTFKNVELTEEEHAALKQRYERTDELIEKVSMWLRTAKNDVPDHFALCVKFAERDEWPKRKVIEPASLPEVNDPIDPEEQEKLVAHMTEVLSRVGEIPSN